MQKEIWRKINNSKNYFISNYGNVKVKGRYIPQKTRNGIWFKRYLNGGHIKPYVWTPKNSFTKYLRVDIYYKNGERKNEQIHRLVAKTFIPNPDNKPQVNHIDGNGANNNIGNLEWATQSENQKHKYRVLNREVWHKRLPTGRKPRSKAIIQKTLEGKLVREWSSCMEAVRELGANKSSLSRCANGKQNEHMGYTWWWKIKQKPVDK